MSCTATTLLLHHSLISLRKPLQLLDFLRQSVCFTVFSSSRESLSLFLMTPSSRHRNPCIYARNHSYRYGSPCVYSRQHSPFSLGDLVFMPDSISMTGLKVSMMLSSKPLVYSWQHIPRKCRFSPSESGQKARYLVVFPTHCSGLTLRNSLGAFRHKQDSTLVAEQTTIFSVSIFLCVNI